MILHYISGLSLVDQNTVQNLTFHYSTSERPGSHIHSHLLSQEAHCSKLLRRHCFNFKKEKCPLNPTTKTCDSYTIHLPMILAIVHHGSTWAVPALATTSQSTARLPNVLTGAGALLERELHCSHYGQIKTDNFLNWLLISHFN